MGEWFVMDSLGVLHSVEAEMITHGANHVSFQEWPNGYKSPPAILAAFYSPAWVSQTDLSVGDIGAV